MVKKYNEFVFETINNKSYIKLTDDDLNTIEEEKSLQKLLTDKSIEVNDNMLIYDNDDVLTKDILEMYFEL